MILAFFRGIGVAYSSIFKKVEILLTVGLNMCVTLKKMPTQAEHIFDTFEYF